MEALKEYLPFLIPLAVIQLGLMIASLVHIFRHKTYCTGNHVLWIAVCVLVSTIGPVLYFAIGKGDE